MRISDWSSDVCSSDLAKASLRLSEKNYERAVELLSRHAGTGVARDQTLSQLEADKATVALKEAMLDKTNNEAPLDGVLGLKQVGVEIGRTSCRERVCQYV